MKLGHVNIYVRDAAASRDWYTKVLGLHTYHFAEGRAAFLSADKSMSHEVALMQLGPDAPLQATGQVGLNHMAWMVDDLSQLKAAYKRLKDNNVKIDHISDHGLSLGIYFRDPDGNGVEVSYELPWDQWPRSRPPRAPGSIQPKGPPEQTAHKRGPFGAGSRRWFRVIADRRRGIGHKHDQRFDVHRHLRGRPASRALIRLATYVLQQQPAPVGCRDR
jgi:catechol 2,3-dioxygenase